MTNIVRSSSDNADRGPSGGIWRDCPWRELQADPNKGTIYFNDFLKFRSRPQRLRRIGIEDLLDLPRRTACSFPALRKLKV